MECETPQFYATSEPIAAKIHRCVECTASIEIGERHFLGRGKWDGKFNTYRQHFLCQKACEFVRDHFNDYECLGFGSLFDWIDNEAWGLEEFKTTDEGKKFRSMIADIKWRERSGKQPCTQRK